MEPSLKERHPISTEHNQDANKQESTENFQKFIYELFDKNGVLNDLRAYLRGHIVDVLKRAETGDPPSCQKHFIQRLDSTYQALNMLVAEYLLCLEFNYSLSVFVSEIPLANMVFGFAKSLMDLGADGEATGLRFKDNDVWSILNYLGMKCDSEHANRIVTVYKTQVNSPLLLCILQCSHLYEVEQMVSSREGSISSRSSNADKREASECRHHAFCRACRSRYRRVKEKYRRKKTEYIQKAQANANALNVETLMKNIGELERNLIDEMFEQLKTVYETEIDMFKTEHEDKIKHSLASHVQHFQRMQHELEESFKAREEALKANIVLKKRFLWGLAQALRAQHSQMSQAMQAVKAQTAEVADQAQRIKLQRTEAEESLRKRAEEMRQQIANELIILERHLESMKTERESINKEKTNALNSEIKMKTEVKTYLQSQYHLWKRELDVLRMHIENVSLQPKSVMERGMMTDDGYRGMNNEVDRGVVKEVRPHQVVNDLKKKNVNFSQCKSEGQSRGSHSSTSSEDEPVRHSERQQPLLPSASAQARLQDGRQDRRQDGWQDGLQEGRQDGRQDRWQDGRQDGRQDRWQDGLQDGRQDGRQDRWQDGLQDGRQDGRQDRWQDGLQDGRQDGWQVGRHSGEQERLQAGLRASTPRPDHSLHETTECGWRKGAGEERSLLPSACILVPGDTIPFVGVVGRRSDSRRHLLNRWRAIRRRVSPLMAAHPVPSDRPAETVGIRIHSPSSEPTRVNEEIRQDDTALTPSRDNTRTKANTAMGSQKAREKSPTSVLKEAKEKLKTATLALASREKSPSAVLREAKLRLRKLEIEAEAVERSYMDFRRRRENRPPNISHNASKLSIHRREKTPEHSKTQVRATDSVHLDLEKYLQKYQFDIDLEEDRFKNRNTAATLKNAVPEAYPEVNRHLEPIPKEDYLDKPILEFRRLYYTNPEIIHASQTSLENQEPSPDISSEQALKQKCSDMRNEKNNKLKELEILKENITKIYDLQDEPTKDTTEPKEDIPDNLLIVEVENVTEVKDLDVESQTNMIVVVESSVDSKEIIASERDESSERISTKMTIVVSPKQVDGNVASDRTSTSLERVRSPQEANFSRIVTKEFYEASGDKDAPGNDVIVEMSTDPDSEIQIQAHPTSEADEAQDDYPDDYSYDVDNYKSDNSPISLPKSEDENFWD